MSPLVAFIINAGVQGMGAALCTWVPMIAWLYPGADVLTGSIIGALFLVPFALVYVLFSISMPRSGGDYVWTSRVLGPRIGYMLSFSFTLWLVILIGMLYPIQASYFSSVFAMLAIGFGYAPMNVWAQLLMTPMWLFAYTIVMTLICFLMVAFGVKYASVVMKVLFFLTILGEAVVFGVLIFSSREAFANGFNHLSSIPYDAVIDTAKTAGFVGPPANLAATMSSIAAIFMMYYGFTFSVYVAGEIKDVKKSMWVSMFGVLIGGIITIGGGAFLIYRLAGFEWFQALSNLFFSYPANYPLPAPPWVYYVALMGTDIQILWTIAGIAFIALILLWPIGPVMVASRTLFAWSFDRIAPTILADVNPRYKSPFKALALIFGVAFVVSCIYIFTTVFTWFANVTLAFSLAAIIPCIAAIVYPRRKEYDDSAAKPFRIGNVPLISICGVIALFVQIFISYNAYATPAISGPVGYPALSLIVLSFVLGPLLFEASRRYHLKKEALDISLSFKEIPP